MKERSKTRRTLPAAALSSVSDCGFRSVAEGGEAIHLFVLSRQGARLYPKVKKLYLVKISIEKLDPQGFRKFFGVGD
jgi:hypothetical protein